MREPTTRNSLIEHERMANHSLRVLYASALLLLGGCGTAPVAEPPVTKAEPPTPTVECPVCAPTVCPEPQVVEVEKIVEACPEPPKVAAAEGVIASIGAVEWAFVEPGDLLLQARIDTGAETTSIHAEQIQLLEKDGKSYVSFTLENPETQEVVTLERRLRRKVLIKQTGAAEPERRYVVRMWITIGKKRTWLDVTLSDRDDFEFPLLVGRNMLVDEFIVDVSKRHTQPKRRPEGK